MENESQALFLKPTRFWEITRKNATFLKQHVRFMTLAVGLSNNNNTNVSFLGYLGQRSIYFTFQSKAISIKVVTVDASIIQLEVQQEKRWNSYLVSSAI